MFDFVEGHGPIPCDLLVVGEAPGTEELRYGIPLVGPTGKEFDNLLRRFIGRQREDAYVTNLFKFPLDLKKKVWTSEQYEWMGEVLRDEIREVDPRVILTLGGIATRWFLGSDYDMEALNGVPHKWGDTRIVVPSIHPAAMFKGEEGGKGGTAILSWVIEAFEMTKKVMEGEEGVWKEAKGTEVYSGSYSVGNVYGVDTEARSNGDPYMVTYSSREGIGCYAYSDDRNEIKWVSKILSGDVVTLLHNALYDLPQLAKLGIYPRKWVDTMQMAFLLETLPLGLKPLAYRLCGMKLMTYDQVLGHSTGLGVDLSEVPENIRLQYACGDADATLRVYNKLLPLFYPRMQEVLERDMDIQPMIIAMMERGMPIDEKYLEELGAEFEVENLWLQEEMRKDIGNPTFNFKSAKQVSELIYKKLKLGKRYRIRQTKWGGATDAKTLKKLEGEHPLVQSIMQYRGRRDLIDKFINTLPSFSNNGRIHADISMVRVPQSGRLACSNPNLLAQPVRSTDGRRIRDAFVASEGYRIVSMDYNQIEMRLMAHLSQDPVMLKVYNNGGDIHTDTAMRTFGIKNKKDVDEIKHRYPSKRTGFGVIYRITAMGLSVQLMGDGLMEWNEERCQWLIDSWLKEHSGVNKFWKKMDAETKRNRYVCDLWGRRKLIPEVVSVYPYIRESGLRKAINVPEQAGAQGIIKEAMKRIWKEGGEEWYHTGLAYPLIQIHDDITMEVREGFVKGYVSTVKPIMEGVIKLSVPIIVDAKEGKRWGSQQKVKSWD